MSDQGTQGVLSPWLRARRLSAAIPHLKGSVLDVGCGSGALADHVPPADYLGYDVDVQSIKAAQSRHPGHTFTQSLPQARTFDTVVSLAVIEHIPNPREFLLMLAGCANPGGRIVISTPNPSFEFIHHAGSKIGVFSHDASEEHVSLLDRKGLHALASSLGFDVIAYRRFLMGANQLMVLGVPSGAPAA
jgi:2-polyprenyl-3-methyl-5-hydroxy-6-metoxy-1,4-benzoquinol methylase